MRRFLALPDGRYAEAAAILDQRMPIVSTGLRDLERGRVFERLGRREEALRAWGSVAERWSHADPELQPYVAEARAALKRLSEEPR